MDVDSSYSVCKLFELQQEKNTDKTALVFGSRRYSYCQLNSIANQLAHYLIDNYGIKKGDVIAVLADPSDSIIVCLLAILKAGSAYLPLSTLFPDDRIDYMINDCDANVVFVDKNSIDRIKTENCNCILIENLESLVSNFSQFNPDLSIYENDIAYIMYTSGTTGIPNGLEIPHRGVVRLVHNAHYLAFNEVQTFLHHSALSFDASTFEIWGALLSGNKLVVYPDRVIELMHLQQIIVENSVSCLWLTSSLFNLIIDESPQVLTGVKFLLTGGEALSPIHILKAQRALLTTQLINGYGPTESTTFATTYCIPKIDSDCTNIPIGRAINETQIYILNPDLTETAIGEIGEIYIGGKGLALRYRNQPELTKLRFIPNPFSLDDSDKLYKSGDLCRLNIDNNIEFIGRKDHQIKIRGFRVELGEIEEAINRFEGVGQCLVVASKTKHSVNLIAYIVCGTSASNYESVGILRTFDLKLLKSHLKTWFPEYMLPTDVIQLNRFPININGKIDRDKLPSTDYEEKSIDDALEWSDLEILLSDIWSNVLGAKITSLKDNFFDLGGYSLLAIKLINEINSKLNIKLRPKDFFIRPTIESFSQYILQLDVEKFLNDDIVLIKKGSNGALFLAPGLSGNAFSFQNFAKHYNGDKSLFVLEYPVSEDGRLLVHSMQDLASYFISKMNKLNLDEPFNLIGYSFGGRLIYEIALQLQNSSKEIGLFCIADATAMSDFWTVHNTKLKTLVRGLIDFKNMSFFVKIEFLVNYRLRSLFLKFICNDKKYVEPLMSERKLTNLYLDDLNLVWDSYQPNGLLMVDLLLITQKEEYISKNSREYYFYKSYSDLSWSDWVKGDIQIEIVDIHHNLLFKKENSYLMVDIIMKELSRLEN